jgi:hypothetical protein
MAIHVHVVYAAVLLFVLFLVANAPAAQVQFAWDPPAETSGAPMIVAGYKLYYGIYDIEGVIDVGNQSVYTLTGLELEKPYFVVVTAYDIDGGETEFSNLVSFTIPDPQAGVPEVSPDRGSSMTWTNYRLNLTMGSEHDDDIGVLFRYQDWDNYYRLLWNNQDGYRRLEKQEKGVFILLAEDTSLSAPMQFSELTIITADEALQIWINDALIFSVTDESFLSGSIALYAFGKGNNYFDDILVEDLDTGSVLLWEDFSSGVCTDWMIVDEGVMRDVAEWSVASGVLVQRADFDAESGDGSDLTHRGTFAVYMP